MKESNRVFWRYLSLILTLLLPIAAIVPAVACWFYQSHKAEATLTEQQFKHANAINKINSDHEAEIMAIQSAHEQEKNTSAALFANMYKNIEELKSNHENEINVLQTQYNDSYDSLKSAYQKQTEGEVYKNAFKVVFGINPNDSNKQTVQQYVNLEFLSMLSTKCELNAMILQGSEKTSLHKAELLRIESKLGYARNLTTYYKFRIPKQDRELEANMKKWKQSSADSQFLCY